MPREVSDEFLAATTAQQSAEDGVTLITITPPSGPVLRLASHALERITVEPLAYGVRSRDEIYYFVLMQASFPDDEEGVPPSTEIIIDNVAAGLAEPLRGLDGTLSVTLEMVKQSDPDTVEFSEDNLEGAASTISAERISLRISTDLFTSEACPCDYMVKENLPGLRV